MLKSSALDLMEDMGRLSFAVMRVRLFPASDIVRSNLSSCSVQRSCANRRIAIIVPLGPLRRARSNSARNAPPSAGMITPPEFKGDYENVTSSSSVTSWR
jgi:hypothetical protein